MGYEARKSYAFTDLKMQDQYCMVVGHSCVTQSLFINIHEHDQPTLPSR